MENFEQIKLKLAELDMSRIAVASAHDEEVLLAVKEAIDLKIATFHLIGDEQKILSIGHTINLLFDNILITDESDPIKSSRKAVESVSSGESQILMKGLVPTATILKAALDKEIGLRTGKILSHVAVIETRGFDRLLFLTDAAMNINPDLEQKVQIVNNSINLARSIGTNEPKVAMITAVETVNPNMQATIDAAVIAKMAERGQIKGAVVDGPLALDNAISVDAAKHKGIYSPVAGLADILVAPNIEMGNALYKSLVYFANAKIGAVIAGAKAPIVLTSRADTNETKLNSIILAVLSAKKINF